MQNAGEQGYGQEKPKRDIGLFQLAVFCMVFVCLIPWFFEHLDKMIGVDIAYLSESAKYLMQGKRMSEFYYDTNPPLSILVYVPNILLQNVTGLSLHAVTTIYTGILLVAGLSASFYCLRRMGGITSYEIMALLCGALVTSTVMTLYDFGQKDHFLSIAILPLVLFQYAITCKVRLNIWVQSITLLVCGVLLLLKPQFGLVPLALFLHRAWAQKRITVCFDVDFVILAAAFFSYLSVIFVFFDDFIFMIMPDSLQYYVAYKNPEIVGLSINKALIPVAVIVLRRCVFKDMTYVAELLAWMSLICIIPFFMQGKGWTYHAFSYTILSFSSLLVLVFHASVGLMHLLELKKGSSYLASLATCLFLLFLGAVSMDKMNAIPSEKSFRDSEIVRYVEGCRQECSFFLFHDFINLSHEAAVYTGRKHASRFPYLWFIQYLTLAQWALDNGAIPLMSQAEIDEAWRRYISMIEEDLVRSEPEIFFLGNVVFRDVNIPEYEHKFDFVESVVLRSEKLSRLWNDYEMVDILHIDRRKYTPNMGAENAIMRFDVYRKIRH